MLSRGGELLTLNGDIVERWKENSEEHLNPTNMSSVEEAEFEDSRDVSLISLVEVTKALKKLVGSMVPGADEICPELLKVLDIVGPSWLKCLFSVTWKSGTVPAEWQTRVVVPIFKKGDRMTWSNYQGIALFSLPGKVRL